MHVMALHLLSDRVDCGTDGIRNTAEEKEEYAKDTKAGRVLSPDEVAFEVFRLAESGESGKILGI